MLADRNQFAQSARRLALWLLVVPSLVLAAEPLKLEISGADGALLENLRQGVSIAAESCDAPAWRVRSLLKRADRELQRAARALGYYRLQVAEKSLQREAACWQARFRVEPGEVVRIGRMELRVSGDAERDLAFAGMARRPSLQPGEPLNHGEYERLKQDLERLALERGYLEARFETRELRVDPAAGRAEIRLHFDSGVRYRVSELNLQQSTYDPELLERYLTLRKGDPYDSDKLNAMQRALNDSGYFERVSVRPDLAGATERGIRVDVELEPRKATAYRFGIGVATDTGPRLSAAYERRRLNRYGHRLSLSSQLSPVDSSLKAEYLIPYNTPHTQQIGLEAAYRHQDTATALSDSYILGLRELGMRGGWNEVRSLEWISEESDIDGLLVDATLLVPSITWSRTRADDRMRPKKGHRLNLNLRGGVSALLSDTSFFQASAGFKWINRLGSGRLLLRGQAGLTEVEAFEKLPASYRFFAGGDQSVRGYEYRSLAPRDSNGRVEGGRYLLSGSIEYEHPLTKEWSVAAFVDAGDAFDSLNTDLRRSIGLGVRWRSPVGPVRLDLAFPSDTSEDDFRIHFSMGPDL
ncbi:MAG: autotransporter assembly complex protein TamA [Gammaproteobacteria bacterium]|nr:autotransporter assembly complex protein TamA [Gammaproteobacteria bacterium]